MIDDKWCNVTVPHEVGSTVKFYMDDDGKRHTGKVTKIYLEVTSDDVKADYEVKTRFRGKQDYARISGKDIIE